MSTNQTTAILRGGRKAKKEPERIRKVVTPSTRAKLSEEKNASHRKNWLALCERPSEDRVRQEAAWP